MPAIGSLMLNQQFSAGSSTDAYQPNAPYTPTPFDIQQFQQVLLDFQNRLKNVEWQVQANDVGSDNILSKISLSPEAILIQSSKIAVVGEVTFADYVRTLNGQSTGVIDPSITQIVGGVIRTGQIQNLNGSSYMNLDATTTGQTFIQCASAVSIFADGQFTFGATVGQQLIYNLTSLSLGGNALLGSSATAVDTVVGGAANGTTALSTKLNKNASDVLGGNITFASSGAFQIGTATWNGTSATGTGVIFNQSGIVAVNAGAIEFVLNGTTGAATFAGALSAATGTFGTVTASAALTVGTGGSIGSGQTAYNTGTGYWLEYNAGTPRMSIGKGVGSGENFFYDGTNVYLNDMLASTLIATANTANTNASSALSQLPNKLNNNAADVLGGNITFGTSGAFQIGTATWNGTSATGTGVIFNQSGIAAVNAGAIEFVLNGSTGAATFAGALNAATGTFAGSLSAATGTFAGALSAATGTFSGEISTSSFVYATGNYAGGAAIYGDNSVASGVAGITSAAGTAGVFAQSNNTLSYALEALSASSSASNPGLSVTGYSTLDGNVNITGGITVTSNTLVANLNASYLNGFQWGTSVIAGAGYTFTMPSAPVAVTSVGWLPIYNTGGTVVAHVFAMTP